MTRTRTIPDWQVAGGVRAPAPTIPDWTGQIGEAALAVAPIIPAWTGLGAAAGGPAVPGRVLTAAARRLELATVEAELAIAA